MRVSTRLVMEMIMDKNRSRQSNSSPSSSGKRGSPAHAGEVKQSPLASADPSTPPADITPEERAVALMALLDQFEALIPNFQHHDKNDIRRVAGVARFAPDLVVPTIATTTSFPPAGDRKLFDVERNQLKMRSNDALGPVIQRLAALRDGLQFTVNNDLAEAGSQALDVYTWAKSYSKRPDAAALHPYVATMSHVVKKVLNRRKKPSAPAPAPSPTTPTPLPPGGQGFLAPNLAHAEPAGEHEYPDHFNEALERAAQD
jgi:hypothetical protein